MPIQPSGGPDTESAQRRRDLGEGQHPKTAIRSVQRALRILEALAHEDEQPLSKIAASVGLSRSTCHHLVATLLHAGYIAQHPTRRTYALGPAARALGRPGSEQLDLVEAAEPVMQRFYQNYGESTMISVLRGRELVTLKTIESTKSVKASYGWGSVNDAVHATAPGKAIAAWLPEENLTHLTGTDGLFQYTAGTITTVDELLEHLRLVRRHRIAYDRDEFVEGLSSVAATVRDPDGAVVGAYACCLPTLRADDETLRRLSEDLIAGAQEIASALRR